MCEIENETILNSTKTPYNVIERLKLSRNNVHAARIQFRVYKRRTSTTITVMVVVAVAPICKQFNEVCLVYMCLVFTLIVEQKMVSFLIGPNMQGKSFQTIKYMIRIFNWCKIKRFADIVGSTRVIGLKI